MDHSFLDQRVFLADLLAQPALDKQLYAPAVLLDLQSEVSAVVVREEIMMMEEL